MLFLASMREMGKSHEIFFKFSLSPSEVVEVEWSSMLNFEAATLKLCNSSWKFGSSPWKGKVDLCMTNGSKFMIYLTLLYFKFYCTLLVSIAKGNIAEVYLTFSRRGAKLSGTIAKFWGCSLKIQHRSSFDLNNLERPKWEFWENVMG